MPFDGEINHVHKIVNFVIIFMKFERYNSYGNNVKLGSLDKVKS